MLVPVSRSGARWANCGSDGWCCADGLAICCLILCVARQVMRKSDFERQQQYFGIAYDTDTLLWDKELRDVFLPKTHMYYDWMHCILCSGGLGQYHVNNFCKAVEKHGLALRELDVFAATVKMSSSHQKLGNNFFESRVNRDADSPIKAFAVEVTSAIFILAEFCDYVLVPGGILPRHSKAMRLLKDIVGICMTGDKAVGLAVQLRDKLQEHHIEVNAIYGTRSTKVKTHLCYHVASNLQEVGLNLSCFSCERRARLCKQAAQNYTNDKHFSKMMLYRMFVMLEASLKEDKCQPEALVGHAKDAPCLVEYFRHLCGGCSNVRVAREMAFDLGHVSQGDFVFYSRGDGSEALGSVYLCVDVPTALPFSTAQCFFVLLVHYEISPGTWAPSDDIEVCPPSRVTEAAIGWHEREGGVHPLRKLR